MTELAMITITGGTKLLHLGGEAVKKEPFCLFVFINRLRSSLGAGFTARCSMGVQVTRQL